MAIVPALLLCSCRSKKVLEQPIVEEVTPQYQEVVSSPDYTTTPATTVEPVYVDPTTDRQEALGSLNANMLRTYNVVVGSFGVYKNAQSMESLMKSRGYQSFLVQNEKGMYRVVAGASDSRQTALNLRNELRKKYKNDDPNTTPKAWILVPLR